MVNRRLSALLLPFSILCGACTDLDVESPIIEGDPSEPEQSDRETRERIVFVTSTRQTAALGGLAGADELCQQEAVSGGIGGTFRAWLSTTGESVLSRFTPSKGPYVRTDGVRVADNWDDLLDGLLLAPIKVDENMDNGSGDVWTGTLADGNPWPDDDCSGFTVDVVESSGACGNAGTFNEGWTDYLRPNCSAALRLYCFEQ